MRVRPRLRRGGGRVAVPSAADRDAGMAGGAGLFGPFTVSTTDADLEIACCAVDVGRGFTKMGDLSRDDAMEGHHGGADVPD